MAMACALGVLVRVCKYVRARCWLVYVGKKQNRIADMESLLEFHRAEEAVRESGWEPKRLNLADVIGDWEQKLSTRAHKLAVLDNVESMEEDIEVEIQEVENIDVLL